MKTKVVVGLQFAVLGRTECRVSPEDTRLVKLVESKASLDQYKTIFSEDPIFAGLTREIDYEDVFVVEIPTGSQYFIDSQEWGEYVVLSDDIEWYTAGSGEGE